MRRGTSNARVEIHVRQSARGSGDLAWRRRERILLYSSDDTVYHGRWWSDHSKWWPDHSSFCYRSRVIRMEMTQRPWPALLIYLEMMILERKQVHYSSFSFYRSWSFRRLNLRVRTRHPRIISQRLPCGHHSFAPVTAIDWSGSPASENRRSLARI